MRLLIRTMTLAIFMVFVIQPSAKAEVGSYNSYWQHLPEAIKAKQQQDLEHFYAIVHWNEVVAWNEAVAAQEKIAKTKQPKPKVTSDVVSQSGDKFDRLANCESGMRQNAVGSGIYLSYFQWLPETWHSVGGTGDPRNASYEEQKEKAKILAAQSGGGTQWPVCWYR